MIAKFYSNHNQRLVLLGTLVGLGLSAVPFAFKDVRRVEQRVQQRALEEQDREEMRNSRLSTKSQ
eukprot:PRCOL_00004284-RA